MTVDEQPKRGRGRPVDPDLAERRRQQLIEAAVDVFAEKGYHAASITDITVAAGLGRGTFYLYYDSKRAILEAVFDLATQRLVEGFLELSALEPAGSAATIDERMAMAGEHLFAQLNRSPNLLRVLAREGMVDDAIMDRFFAMGDAIEAYATLALQQAADAGALREGLDPAVLAHILVGVATGGLLKASREPMSEAEQAAHVRAVVGHLRVFLRD